MPEHDGDRDAVLVAFYDSLVALSEQAGRLGLHKPAYFIDRARAVFLALHPTLGDVDAPSTGEGEGERE